MNTQQHTPSKTANMLTKAMTLNTPEERACFETSAHRSFSFVNASYTLALAKRVLKQVGNMPRGVEALIAWHAQINGAFADNDFLNALFDKYSNTNELARNLDDMTLLRSYLAQEIARNLLISEVIILDTQGKAIFNNGANIMLELVSASSFKLVCECVTNTVNAFLSNLYLRDKISVDVASDLNKAVQLYEKNGIADVIFNCFDNSGMDTSSIPDGFGQTLFDLAFSSVHKSQKFNGRLASFSTLAKMLTGITTPIKVNKFLDKIHLDERIPARTYQNVATAITSELVDLGRLGDLVTYHDSYDGLGWIDGYKNARGFHSCMTISSYDDYVELGGELGEAYTAECYSSGFHGLPDNGLVLAVMCHDDGEGVVARAITFNQDGQDYYLKCYGDDRLEAYLTYKGYKQADGLPIGTILYTEKSPDDEYEQAFYKKPYIDGDNHLARADEIDGVACLIISKSGNIYMQSTNAFECAD